jgi:hypothetical protein
MKTLPPSPGGVTRCNETKYQMQAASFVATDVFSGHVSGRLQIFPHPTAEVAFASTAVVEWETTGGCC